MAKKPVQQLDPKAQRVLREITRNIPVHLVDTLTHEEVDTSQEDAARAAIKGADLPTATRRKILKHIREGRFRSVDTVVDEKVKDKIEEYHEGAVRAAIKSGRLPDPKKDPFIKERAWRTRNGK